MVDLSSKKRTADLKVDVCLEDEVCAHAVTHPGGHASRRKPGDVVLKVDSANSDDVHLVCWVVQGAKRQKCI